MNRALPVLLSIFLALSASAALAQPLWQPTGTVELTIDGEPRTFHSYTATVDEELAEDIEDAEAQEFAQRVAGSEQNSATWMLLDAITAGTIEITPATLFVTVSARGQADPLAEGGQLDFDFALDPETLTREAMFDPEVMYYPESFALHDFYALTDGTLVLESVEVVGDRTLSVRGSISGTLTFQEDSNIEHNPDRALRIDATFDIEQVDGSDLLVDLLTEEQ